MSTTLAPEDVAALGRTDGDGEVLARLAADQHTRRLLLLRVLLDAVDSSHPAGGAAGALAREHAALLESVERQAPAAARRVLFYSLTGAWAERCVQGLETGGPPAAPGTARDLAHLGSLAAAAAIRAGTGFTTRVAVHGGRITLPTLGALRCPAPDGSTAELAGQSGLLVMRVEGGPPAEVRLDAEGRWTSPDDRWTPLHTLDGGPREVLLDDQDPGPFAPQSHAALGHDQRARWSALWRDALPLLGLGGAARSAELALLDCIVPAFGPPGGAAEGAHISGTSAIAFGAVLASEPPGPAFFAAGLAHELQHAKLAALSELLPLHTADGRARHWAPWRPDPRPFHGLLHGAYAHLALAGFWQSLAVALDDPAGRDLAWAAHARSWTQVGAVLPVLRGSRHLTDAGRLFTAAMAARHEQLREPSPPKGHLVRAAAYVETARMLWSRRHGRSVNT